MGETITLSKRELERVTLLQQCVDKQLTQVSASQRLQLSYRHTKRLVAALRAQGAQGLVSKRRGKPSNNRIPDTLRRKAMQLIQEKYSDFGPTFALEKLQQLHGIKVSVETCRKWMQAEGLWKGKKRKALKLFQTRQRRPQYGDLVQIDGSPHDWLEGRDSPCTLLVFVDDATSKLLYLQFVPAETTHAYMQGLKTYLKHYGRPVAVYSDRHSIFRVNQGQQDNKLTQFGRALAALDIQAIHAKTPQAKGRVERSNQTLQDRLVKEMRLANIQTVQQANAFLPRFMESYNRQFAVQPALPQDAHRPVLHADEEVERILSIQETRKLSKNLTCQFENRLYQLQLNRPGYTLRRACITVCKALDGKVALLYKNKSLPYTCWEHGQQPPPLADDKQVNACVEQAKKRQGTRTPWRPAIDHPWKQGLPNRRSYTGVVAT